MYSGEIYFTPTLDIYIFIIVYLSKLTLSLALSSGIVKGFLLPIIGEVLLYNLAKETFLVNCRPIEQVTIATRILYFILGVPV